MWEGYYGKEPFDLRLTVLRFLRCLNKILLLTLAGTLLFGGGYYIKNVMLRPEKQYSVTSTFKVEYVNPPVQSGDYYINSMTWNTLVQSQEFLSNVQKHLAEGLGNSEGQQGNMTVEELAAGISATLPSDWNIPTITVVTNDPAQTLRIAAAVEAAMENEFVEDMAEIQAVRVIDAAISAEEVALDVRPVRAFVLSGILSLFFVSVLFLLKETGDDSIWLPTTLKHRYGLPVLGTINSTMLKENMCYFMRNKETIAICPMDDRVRAEEVVKALKEKGIAEREGELQFTAAQSPLSHPESCQSLREADGILLVVPAGNHSGKPLEYVLDLLKQQDCKITGVILWGADEKLLKAYYCFAKDASVV